MINIQNNRSGKIGYKISWRIIRTIVIQITSLYS